MPAARTKTARPATAQPAPAPAPEPEPAGPAPTPIPTAVRRDWFPTAVRLPDGVILRRVKVFATDAGLYIYSAIPTENPEQGLEPVFFSPIHYDKTPTLPSDYAARQVGIPLYTDAGQVTVQPVGSCGCDNRAFADWRPVWASRIEPWRAS